MKKISLLCAFYSLIAHGTIIEKIPSHWLKNTTFYLQDKGDSMLLGQLFIRLDKKKMGFGEFLAELIQIINAQSQTNKRLETRIASLEQIIKEIQQAQSQQPNL